MIVLKFVLAVIAALVLIAAAVGLCVLALLALGFKELEDDDDYNPNDYNPDNL